MPMFDGGGDGHVLDLVTAVKYGVLGGGGGVVGVGSEGGEKLDLRMMVEELELFEVPSVFICPISLEPMQDPVTLCTGQTYEKSNILKWFGLGHLTCPTTLQELWDDAVTPNRTLYHLIYTWFSQKYRVMKKKAEDVQGRAAELVATLKTVKGQDRVQALKELRQVVVVHASARQTLIDKGWIAVVSSLLGPFTSHVVGSVAIAILVNLSLDSGSRMSLMQPAKVSLLVDILNEGSIETKINFTRLIKMLMDEKDFRSEIVSSHSLVVGIMRLVKDRRHKVGVLPGVSLLRTICLHEEVKSLIVSIGVVPQLVECLSSLDKECLELVLFVLDTLSSLPEGVLALKKCSNTIPNMVRLLMRTSESCTQHALSILLSICKLSP